MCRVLNVSRSGYYRWCEAKQSESAKRRMQLDVLVAKYHALHKQKCGIRRIHKDLLEFEDLRVSFEQVRRSFHRLELTTRGTRKYKAGKPNTVKGKHAENVIAGDFSAKQPNSKWVADTTQIWTTDGWLHLAVVMDLYSRMVVGYAMSLHNNADLVCEATRNAIKSRRPPPGLILHTDRGSTYISLLHQTLLSKHGIQSSMSRLGNCYDNAAMESWNGRFKVEACYGEPIRNARNTRKMIEEHIHYYNHWRRHSANGLQSPHKFEQSAKLNKAV